MFSAAFSLRRSYLLRIWLAKLKTDLTLLSSIGELYKMAKSLSGRVFLIICLLVHAQSSMSVLLKDGFKNGILAWLWAL